MRILVALILSLIVAFNTLADDQLELSSETIKNIQKNLPVVGKTFVEIHNKLCKLENADELDEFRPELTDLDIKTKKLKRYSSSSFVTHKLEIFVDGDGINLNKIEVTASTAHGKNNTFFNVKFFDRVSQAPFLSKEHLILKGHTSRRSMFNDCYFMELVRFYKKGERSDHLVYLELNDQGIPLKKHYSDQPPLSLNEIYSGNDELIERIKDIQKHKRIKVGIIDSGVDYNHPALAYKIDRRYSFEEEIELLGKKSKDINLRESFIRGIDLRDRDSAPYDFDGIKKTPSNSIFIDYHGTEVAHALTMDTDKIVLTIGKFGYISLPSIPQIVEQQISAGARIINMSFNYSSFLKKLGLDFKLRKVIKNNPEVLFVVSAGNDGEERANYPGSFNSPNIINVGATGIHDELWSHSTYGKTVFIAARGIHQLYRPGNSELAEFSSGTSFAAPVVAKIAALMLYENPSLKPNEIKRILCSTADKKDELKGKFICPGIVNEERAVSMAKALSM